MREHLTPLEARFPADSPHPQLERIFGEASRVAREKARRQAERTKILEQQPPEVQQLARLIAGRKLVVIGGTPKTQEVARIEEAFDCEVDWVPSKRHDSPRLFKPHIIRDEVIIVLLLIRWSSHVYSEIDTFCREHGKILVRVPAGYNVRTLAQVILAQAGQRLGKDAPQFRQATFLPDLPG